MCSNNEQLQQSLRAAEGLYHRLVLLVVEAALVRAALYASSPRRAAPRSST